MNVLVTGITGSIGSILVPRLQRDGHVVRGLSRRELPPARDVQMVRGDAVSGRGLEQALDGIDVAYFLIHSMEPALNGAASAVAENFSAREHTAAENFARAASNAGVQRIIYLGGMLPAGGPASAHLASRLAVENILHEAVPCAVTFRASIVIGSSSRSFRFLVRLVERMPVLLVPAWRNHRTAPIDERDVTELLVGAATNDKVCGESLDIGGPDLVDYGELIDRIRDAMLLGRPTVGFKRLTVTPIASRVAAVIAGERYELIGPLMESLGKDLIPRDNRAAEILGVRLHSLDSAIEHALAEWEAVEPLAAR